MDWSKGHVILLFFFKFFNNFASLIYPMIDSLRCRNKPLHYSSSLLISHSIGWHRVCTLLKELKALLQPTSCVVETTKPQDYKHSPQHHMEDTMGDRTKDEDKTTIGQAFRKTAHGERWNSSMFFKGMIRIYRFNVSCVIKADIFTSLQLCVPVLCMELSKTIDTATSPRVPRASNALPWLRCQSFPTIKTVRIKGMSGSPRWMNCHKFNFFTAPGFLVTAGEHLGPEKVGAVWKTG